MRSFTIVSAMNPTTKTKLKKTGGRYISDTPEQAAKKMFSQSTKRLTSLIITLRETTQNSLHKEYKYKIKRVKNETLVELKDVDILYKYKLVSKSLN